MRRVMSKSLTASIILIMFLFPLMVTGCKNDKKISPVNNRTASGEAAVKSGEKKDGSSKQEAEIAKDTQKKYGDVKGFLWEVKKGNATVYMYGSIHVGDKKIYPLCQEVEDAYDKSNIVVGEIDITNTKALTEQAQQMIYTNGDTAYDHMSSDGKKRIQTACGELNFNPTAILHEKVWALASIISDYQMKKAGYDANYGIDMYFMNRAKGKKKIMEVEGAEFQFDLINSFSDEEQEKYFVDTISTVEATKKSLDQMFDIFKTGDEKAMLKALGDDDKNSIFYKKMIADRNRNMAKKVEEYLNNDNTYFMVVGLAHYLGDDGVIQLLRDKGYTVTRK